MYVRVKTQGGSRAFVLVESVREGTKIRQRFVCHLGSFPKGHDLRTQDLAFCAFYARCTMRYTGWASIRWCVVGCMIPSGKRLGRLESSSGTRQIVVCSA